VTPVDTLIGGFPNTSLIPYLKTNLFIRQILKEGDRIKEKIIKQRDLFLLLALGA
jgi:hypothetical protein